MREGRWMRCIDRLKLPNESKSTRLAGKLFQRFTTRSAKKLHLIELLQKCLKIQYGWSLVELDRIRRNHLGLHEQANRRHCALYKFI